MKKSVATFDLEADGFLENVTRVWCCVIKEHGTNKVYKFTPDDIEFLPAYLEKYDVLIGHNCIQYDFPVLRKVFDWEYNGIKVDTLLMSRMQRPSRTKPRGTQAGPHSVEAWGIRLGLPKVAHEDWSQYTPEMLERCEQDVEIQVAIYRELLREGRNEGWTNAHKLNHKLFHYLQRQEEYGWYVDRAWLDRCIHTLNRWIDRIDRAVNPYLPLMVEVNETKTAGEYNYVRKPFTKAGKPSRSVLNWDGDSGVVSGPFSRITFRPVDLDKNLEVKNYLLSQGWEPDEWNENNTGERTSPKLSKNDHFNGVRGSLGRLIAKRVQCKQRRGVLEGWREQVREDGRISAQIAGIATTGRIRHKGIVNVPSPHSNAFFAKAMRQVFSSRPGYVLVGCDSKGNQIRQLAARMNDDEFTDAVLYGNKEDGTDLHSLNQRRSGAPSRSQAKNFFYGFIFGAGANKIATTIGISVDQAKNLVATYLNELPRLKELIETLTAEWQKTARKWYNKKWGRMEYRDGYIRGLDGRPIQVDSEHKILCYTLQSDEAIQMAAAYVWFNKKMEEQGYVWGEDYGCVIWMHDEFQVEVKEKYAKDVAKLAEESIAWAGRFYNIPVPHEGEAVIGKNWYETH